MKNQHLANLNCVSHFANVTNDSDLILNSPQITIPNVLYIYFQHLILHSFVPKIQCMYLKESSLIIELY